MRINIYEEIGVRRIINASFCLTELGGSTLSQEVLDAMIEADRYYVSMRELEEKAGEIIAGITGAEAAYVTTGAFSALVLSAAACITGKDPEKMSRLPDTAGMKNEIIIQRNLRSVFDRSMEISGGEFVVIEPTLEALEASITEKTAAIHYLPQLDPPRTDVIPLERVIEIGHRHGVPIIVDAAGQTYPLDRFKMFVRMGADLVCYSGKYFGGPSSTGFVCGRKDLVEAVAGHSFVGPSEGWLGRGYKLDRQQIVALIVALQRWIGMDHEKRLQKAYERRNYLIEALKDVSGIKLTTQPYSYHVVGLLVIFEKKTPEETAKLADKLRDGDPSIWVRQVIDNSILINTLFLMENDERIIGERLKSLIAHS
jgi:L-seryl-tRNA(Ser) seleniumtransferase